MTHPLFIVLILTIANISFGVDLKVDHEWKYLDYRWKNLEQKEEAKKNGNYTASACILNDVDKAPDGRVFVTVVRNPGVPASLMTVSDEIGPGGPLLSPYPDWSWYSSIDCDNNTIISVHRVSIKCNHLFVLDSGKIGEDTICLPKLLIFNLGNNKLIKTIPIPPNIATNENGTGLLVTPIAQVKNCENINNVTVYIADIRGKAVVRYNENLGFCRIESTYMEPTDPIFTIANQSFYSDDGPLGIAVTPHEELYYATLAGDNVYKMDMCNVRECINSKLSNSKADKLIKLAGTLSGQTAPIASSGNIIFFGNIPDTSILCANANRFNSSKTVIVKDSEKLQFPSGLKIIKHEFIWQLLIATNRIQRVLTKTLDFNETNFRILVMDMSQILENTSCFASDNHYGYTPWYIESFQFVIETFTGK